jgi:coenzyme F420-0:L-glutamate ligase / coenzyme F420-1:gamma-L-glutamate ligase
VSKSGPANSKPRTKEKGRTPNKYPAEVRLIPISFKEEIKSGDALVKKLLQSMRQNNLTFEAGDILIVKHKIVSKSEGRIVDLDTIKPTKTSASWAAKYNLDARAIQLALSESRAIIRRKNGVLITETKHGFLCANSGVDVSNVDGGRHALLLPSDPDSSARQIYREIKKLTGLSIPVLICDTFGRPWREGLVDFCIGIAGMKPLRDDRGRRDPHGYTLHASIEAVADELACAAGLVCGKLNRTPACIIRGFTYQHAENSSVRDLLRPAASDLFR